MSGLTLLTQSRRAQAESRRSMWARGFAVLCGRAIFAAIDRASLDTSLISAFFSVP
jgi:hypothetical protein